MNWIHLHLALNHIPVLGVPFLLLLLIAGLVKRSDEIIRLSLWWIVVLTLIAIPIKFTGDFAYEAVKNEPWLVDDLAITHEESGDQATTGVFLLGIAAATGLVVGRKGRPIPRWAMASTIAMALITALLMMRAANLGGQIRHEEIRVSHENVADAANSRNRLEVRSLI